MEFEFNYTRLFVKDYKTCLGFYSGVLGLKTTFASDIDEYAELTNGEVKLTLLSQNQAIGHFGSSTDFAFGQKKDGVALSFRVKDVDEACEYLKAKNIEVVSPPCNFADLGIKAALSRDPDGNLIELTQMGDMVGADSNG